MKCRNQIRQNCGYSLYPAQLAAAEALKRKIDRHKPQLSWLSFVAYALLLVTQLDKAAFALIRFARRGNFHTDHYPAGQVTTRQIMEDAQNCGFLNGGTDYETPLNEAIRLMEENDYRNADIAFITDGFCDLSKEFIQKLREKSGAGLSDHRYPDGSG